MRIRRRRRRRRRKKRRRRRICGRSVKRILNG